MTVLKQTLGQTIQIPFSDGTTHDFKLTGILDVKTGDIGRYTAIISKELVRQQYGYHAAVDYYIGLKDAQSMSEEDAAGYANTLAQQFGISDDHVIVRSTYFDVKDENRGSDMLFYFLCAFLSSTLSIRPSQTSCSGGRKLECYRPLV